MFLEDGSDGAAKNGVGGVGFSRGFFADVQDFFNRRREGLGQIIFTVGERAALVGGPCERTETRGERENIEDARATACEPSQRGGHGNGDATPEVIFQGGAFVAIGAHEGEAGEDGEHGAN